MYRFCAFVNCLDPSTKALSVGVREIDDDILRPSMGSFKQYINYLCVFG